MPNRIFIIDDRCTGCGLCVKSCPVNCISMVDRPPEKKSRYKKLAVIDEVKCIFCNACVKVCDELYEKSKLRNPDAFKAIIMEKEEVEKEKIDISTYKNVWCFAEQRHGKVIPTIYELLYIGRKLAQDLNEKLCAVLIGNNISSYAGDLIDHGADIVYILDNPIFENFLDEVYTNALADIIRKEKPNKFLLPASTIGRSFASRLAVTINTGLTADATGLEIDKETKLLHATRPAFGGNLMATILCEKNRPEMVTVRPMNFPKAQKLDSHKGEIINIPVEPEKIKGKAKFLEFIPEKADTLDITQAEIIVSGGRGLGKPEGFKVIEELAKVLGGGVGASRPTVDAGWISYKHQVGLTGRTVKPKIYFACGISGQVQHLAGMSSSDVIVAINKDPEAPMMKLATFSVEGDLYEIIPLLVDEIKKVKGI